MTEQPENFILRLLQEIRADIAERDERAQAQIASLAQGQLGMRAELRALHDDNKDIRADIKELSGKFTQMTSHLHEIAMCSTIKTAAWTASNAILASTARSIEAG